jgi:beta-galactosidase
MTDQDGTLIAMYPPHNGRLCFGADYNPEQWPTETWREDVALMREAGVTMATVGVFSWAALQPAPGEYRFDWLDEVLDLLHAGGIAVDLATATAAPPPWFSAAYPQSLPVDRDGRRLTYGSRQAYCPSSPDYRAAALDLVRALASRYAQHPALALWHINNEYGCHVSRCYCDTSAAAFRDWLLARYDKDLDALNAAWGTAFWSQRYTEWSQVQPPRATPSFPNPAQELDFRRFSSDALLALCTAERDVLRELTPDTPVTTNFMAGSFDGLDYWRWAPQLDIVSNDHYLLADQPDNYLALAYSADLTRSFAGGEWLLMEHSTSAVNWQPRNVPKRPGELIRNSLSHIARGSQGAMFFQWRASRAGAEKWHSAMVPHAGADSDLFRDVVKLGAHLRDLSPALGSTVDAPVALLHSYPSFWAQQSPSQPSEDMRADAEVQRWHGELLRMGITADMAEPGADLSGYRVVLVPSLYLVSDADAVNIRSYVDGGGTLLVGPYSGIVDEHDQVRLGGYPGAFRELLGIRVEEFAPLLAGATVRLDNGATGQVWSERCQAQGAEVLARYADAPLSGLPALTRNGRAWYVGTRLAGEDLRSLLATVCAAAGVSAPLPRPPAGLEVVRRIRPDGTRLLFLINHASADAPVELHGTDLLTGTNNPTGVPAGGVVVLHEAA